MMSISFPRRLGRRLLLLLPVTLLLGPGYPAWGGSKKQTICCRISGGTRSSGLRVWGHLVPPTNRFNPGSVPKPVLLQGVSAKPTGMNIRLLSMQGKLISEYLLEPQSAGVTVLTLPPLKASPVVWESVPTSSPDRPPTRTVLDRDLPQTDGPAEQMMRNLNASCGGSVGTAELLRAFDLESLQVNLPPTMPVRCVNVSP